MYNVHLLLLSSWNQEKGGNFVSVASDGYPAVHRINTISVVTIFILLFFSLSLFSVILCVISLHTECVRTQKRPTELTVSPLWEPGGKSVT